MELMVSMIIVISKISLEMKVSMKMISKISMEMKMKMIGMNYLEKKTSIKKKKKRLYLETKISIPSKKIKKYGNNMMKT